MAVVRDPAFWKRFSTAVHLDEESTTRPVTPATTSIRPPLKHADSWLERQQQKKRKNRWTLCLSILGFVVVVTVIILLLFWMSRHGWFAHGEKVSFP
ncbi:hypothetical protein MMC30_001861 [Trapelia coarctata]|nr:hypothetical protein [Trapelia coarctata]